MNEGIQRKTCKNCHWHFQEYDYCDECLRNPIRDPAIRTPNLKDHWLGVIKPATQEDVDAKE